MYTSTPIILDTVSNKVKGYTAMTYQAIQVGSSAEEEEVKNRHQNPDLGIWNCCISKDKESLVDSVLTKIAAKALKTYCWTVDLSEETMVEPTISLLQGALVRHLIENPPADKDNAPEEETPKQQTSTTTLYQLQATQFGLATEDKESTKVAKNINQSYKDIKTTIMICAILPLDTEEVSETAYRKKQATALIIYHLRKYASAINASLCFVEPAKKGATASSPSSPTKESQNAPPSSSSTLMHVQPAVDYDKLSQLWRDLAQGKAIWMTEESETPQGGETEEQPATSTPLYGPGRHQDDLIDTVLLRNANYPGHWDATKDSLWVALPTPQEAAPEAAPPQTGDEGWLGQLRGSITADAPKPLPSPEKPKVEEPKEKDAAVSSFFESLLKDP